MVGPLHGLYEIEGRLQLDHQYYNAHPLLNTTNLFSQMDSPSLFG